MLINLAAHPPSLTILVSSSVPSCCATILETLSRSAGQHSTRSAAALWCSAFVCSRIHPLRVRYNPARSSQIGGSSHPCGRMVIPNHSDARLRSIPIVVGWACGNRASISPQATPIEAVHSPVTSNQDGKLASPVAIMVGDGREPNRLSLIVLSSIFVFESAIHLDHGTTADRSILIN